MNTSAIEQAGLPRHERLSAATDLQHEQLHTVVAAANPFVSRERFATWVAVQYRFQSEIEPLYALPALQPLLPDLANRGRLAAAAADLADLGASVPEESPSIPPVSDAFEAIGWLFVSEGSTLGAAVLLKRAQALGLSENFGAHHLAAAPEGRARHWKQFVQAMDELTLDDGQERRMLAAACTAFRRFDTLLKDAFQLPA